jgi:hypothetical protein
MGRVRVEYVAGGKEKLGEVAKKYGMDSHDLARINRISYDTVLKKGDKVIVYQVADPKRSERAEEQWKKTPKARRGKVSGERAVTSASADEDKAEKPKPSSDKAASEKPEKQPADDPEAEKTAPAIEKTQGPVTSPSQVD